MKHRSPLFVMLLGIGTLTLYDFFWFGATARELSGKTGQKLKSSAWLIFFAGFRIFATVALLWVAYVFFVAPTPTSVSQECWRQQSLSDKPQTRGTVPFTNECKQSIANFYGADSRQAQAFGLAAVISVAGIINFILFARWLNDYVKAAEVATGAKLSSTNSMLALLGREPYGVALLQQAYNNPASMPALASADFLPPLQQTMSKLENRTLRRILITIIVVMGAAFLLFVAFVLYGLYG